MKIRKKKQHRLPELVEGWMNEFDRNIHDYEPLVSSSDNLRPSRITADDWWERLSGMIPMNCCTWWTRQSLRMRGRFQENWRRLMTRLIDLTDRDIRQRKIVPPEKLAACHVVVIGVGAFRREVAVHCSGHNILDPNAFLKAGLPAEVVDHLTRTYKSDGSPKRINCIGNSR